MHLAQCADVSKPRGLEAGKVLLARYKTIHATPLRAEDVTAEETGTPDRD